MSALRSSTGRFQAQRSGWTGPLAVALFFAAVAGTSVNGTAVWAVGPDAARLKSSQQSAVEFLKSAQRDDGSWTASEAPGITGLVAYALLKSGVPASDPVIEKAVKHLLAFRQQDGGIYNPKTYHGNYETAIVLMVLEAANQPQEFRATAETAEKYLRQTQWDESEKINAEDVKFGGSGYGRNGDRPDLSNTVFLIDALQARGAKSDDPALQKAIVFLSRCQNLETENNTTPFAAKVNDGGFYYTPAAGGSSQAGNTPEGGLRSYGSMTYAGLKSLVAAGLTKDDPRVAAARKWITQFYTVSENPGMGQQGLYYYHQAFAKCLAALGEDEIRDADGVAHDWRKDLAERLFEQQQPNGSWVNTQARWLEGDPNLSTAYALIALSYCLPPAGK